MHAACLGALAINRQPQSVGSRGLVVDQSCALYSGLQSCSESTHESTQVLVPFASASAAQSIRCLRKQQYTWINSVIVRQHYLTA